MDIIVNPYIQSLKESSTLAINQKAKSLRNQGKEVVHFGFGQSPFEVHRDIQNALRENSFHKEYLPTLGLLELRQQISKFYKQYYDCEFSPENVIIGPGSKELIFQAIFALEGPLLIPAPSWVSYGPQAHIRGKQVVAIPTNHEEKYKLTPDKLEAICQSLVNEQQKILIINSPNNPTGAVYHEDEIISLVEVCRKWNVVVISDEIYSLVKYDSSPYCSFMKHYPEGSIVTSGLSKGFSAGGYRLGFLACSENQKELIRALAAMVSETFSAVSAPTQYAAIKAFEYNKELRDYTERCTSIHAACGKYLAENFRRIGLNCIDPEGGFYLFPDFQNFSEKLAAKNLNGSHKLCSYLLEHHNLACLPSCDFYYTDDYLGVRIATVDYDGAQVFQNSLQYQVLDSNFVEQECPNLPLGVQRIEQFLSDL